MLKLCSAGNCYRHFAVDGPAMLLSFGGLTQFEAAATQLVVEARGKNNRSSKLPTTEFGDEGGSAIL
jgi:hypothetical protein